MSQLCVSPGQGPQGPQKTSVYTCLLLTVAQPYLHPACLHHSPHLARASCLVLATWQVLSEMCADMDVPLTSISSELHWLLEKHQLPQCCGAAGHLWVGSSEEAGLLCMWTRSTDWVAAHPVLQALRSPRDADAQGTILRDKTS